MSRKLGLPIIKDSLTAEGSHRIMLRIAAYWAKKGKKPNLIRYRRQIELPDLGVMVHYDVRSDMLNGLPRE